jgi:hypothetical protein
MHITIRYTCHSCGLLKLALDVPARVDEDVVTWMKSVQQLVGVDHHRRSPACPSRHCDLMVPITGAAQVGGPVLQ